MLYVIEQIINIFPQQLERKRLAKEKEKYKQLYSTPPRLYSSTSSYYVGEKLGNPHNHDECDDDDDHSDYTAHTLGRPGSRGGMPGQRFCYPFYGSCNDIVFRLQSRSKNNLLVGSSSRPYSLTGDNSDNESGAESVKFLPRSGSLDQNHSHRSNTLPSPASRREVSPVKSAGKQYTKPEVIGDGKEGEEKGSPKGVAAQSRSKSHGDSHHTHRHNYQKGHGHGHSHSHSHGHSHGKSGHHVRPHSEGHSHGHSHGTAESSHKEESHPPQQGHGHGHGHGHGDGSCTGYASCVFFKFIFIFVVEFILILELQ